MRVWILDGSNQGNPPAFVMGSVVKDGGEGRVCTTMECEGFEVHLAGS